MKSIKIIFLGLVCYLIIACSAKTTSLKFEVVPMTSKVTTAYLLDYTYSDNGGQKDTLIINTPISFRLINNSNDKYVYEEVMEAKYRYSPYVIIDNKKYNVRTIFDSSKKIYVNAKSTSDIINYFQTPISKKTLEEELKIEKLLNDEKLGDSIVTNKITKRLQDEINKDSTKDMFIIKLKNLDNEKNMGIRYCFNKNKAVIYDVDSLNKVNPRYMWSCDKDF